jgi:hypothetical protein
VISDGSRTIRIDESEGRFSLIYRALVWFEGDSQVEADSGAAWVSVEMTGVFQNARPRVTGEEVIRGDCYFAQVRRATPDEASSWMDTFLNAIGSDPAVASGMILSLKRCPDRVGEAQDSSSRLIRHLGKHAPFKRAGRPEIIGSAPGGRTLVWIPVNASRQHFGVAIEMVRTRKGWQAIHIEFQPISSRPS